MAWYDGLNERMNARAGEQDAARAAAATEAERRAKARSVGEATGTASEAARSAAGTAVGNTYGGGATTQPVQQTGIAGVDTNIDTSALDSVNTSRLGDVAADISNVGEQKITASDVDRFSSIRPENEYEKTLQSTIGKLEDYTSGVSQADRTAANYMLSRFDASSAASNLAQAQRTAANPYLSEGAKAAAIAEQARETGTQRADVVGKLAQQAQERAYQATQKLADVAQTAAAFKEGQFEFDVGQAGEELSRNLTAKAKAGELTQAQVAAELDKASRQINAATVSKQLELDKQKAVAADDNAKEQISQQQAELAMAQQSYYGSAAANMVMSAWDNNPNLTSSDILNNPATKQAMTNYHQSMPGNEGTIPDEDDIAAYMSQMKPSWLVDKETFNRNMNDLKTTMINSGADTTEVDNMLNYIQIVNDSGGTMSVDSNGNIFIAGADGLPMTTVDEYGNTVSLTTGKSITSGKDILSSITSVIPSSNLEQFADGIKAGDYVDADEFITYARQAAKDNNKTLSASDEELTKVYNDMKSGKITSFTTAGDGITSSTGDTDEFDPATGDVDIDNVWSKNNRAILSDPNNEKFDVALNNAIDDAIDGTGKSNLLSQISSNPKLKDELFRRAINYRDLPDSARNPGDLFIDESGNLRLITRQEGKSTYSFILSKKPSKTSAAGEFSPELQESLRTIRPFDKTQPASNTPLQQTTVEDAAKQITIPEDFYRGLADRLKSEGKI